MRYAVDEQELEDIRRQASLGRAKRSDSEDREITLGMRSLLGIFFGLVLICGIFFGLGYSVGRGSTPKVVSQAAETPGAPVTATSQAKPSPDQGLTPAPVQTAAPAVPATGATTAPTESAQTVTVPTNPPAMTPVAAQSTAQSSTPAIAPVALRTQPAAAPALRQPASAANPSMGTYMVQIAAVRVQQDANVLVTALQRHGYQVVIRHEPQDTLLHVQVGPFMTRAQAAAMRSRLLADGYNAVIKQ